MGLSTIISIIMFFKELIFGKKSIHENKSFTAKAKSWFVFIILIVSLGMNYFLGNKIYRLTFAYISLDKEKKNLQLLLKENEKCHIANDAFEKLMQTCRGK